MITKEIEELRKILETVEIRQNGLRREIRAVRTKIDRLSTTGKVTQEEILPNTRLHHGDKVTVLNPSKGQEKEGIICGTTIDNLIKLKTPKGKIIRRLPKNLLVQWKKEAEEPRSLPTREE